MHTSKVYFQFLYASMFFLVTISQNIRDILLVGHRQAVAWLDEWHGKPKLQSQPKAYRFRIKHFERCSSNFCCLNITLTQYTLSLCVCVFACMHACLDTFPIGLSLEEVREYEQAMQEKTNSKVKSSQNNTGEVAAPDLL